MEGNKVYVLGGAQTDFERNWTKEGKNEIALLKEAVKDALRNTNISMDDIKTLNKKNKAACFVGNFIAENYINQGHLGALVTEIDEAFYGIPTARYEAACASGSVALDNAISRVRLGDYDLAIVIGWELMKTVSSKVGADFIGKAAYYTKEAKGIEFPFPKLFGKIGDEFVRRYSLDEEMYMSCLARISANNYDNAKRNPLAQTRKWYMDYEQASKRNTASNPLVGGRLAISDCSQVTDGAAVVILASEKFVTGIAGRTNEKYPIVKGFGHRTAPMLFDTKMKESKDSEFVLPWTRKTILDAYQRADLYMDDIDVFETHDCFSSSEYAAISAFGITKPGYEYEAVNDGTILFGGKKPINPSGGLIGCGHPIGGTGVRMFLDIYKQVSEKAGSYQVPDVKNALMLNIGGTATTNYSFIVGKE